LPMAIAQFITKKIINKITNKLYFIIKFSFKLTTLNNYESS